MRLAILLSLCFAIGCNSGGGNQPAFGELYPVKGVVLRGGQPVAGGTIRFT